MLFPEDVVHLAHVDCAHHQPSLAAVGLSQQRIHAVVRGTAFVDPFQNRPGIKNASLHAHALAFCMRRKLSLGPCRRPLPAIFSTPPPWTARSAALALRA